MIEVLRNAQAIGRWLDGLADTYPDAKVILTERDPEAWFRSTQATIFPMPQTNSTEEFRKHRESRQQD